jgi:murein DD-endopeptidase MepM/ murein hydrolase activator NlpD
MRRQLALKDPILSGEDIMEVQRKLGLKGKAVDGFYGSETAAAVEAWKWRVGYPKSQINNRLGLIGLAWLFDEEPFPGPFAKNAADRKGKPFPSQNGITRPLGTSPGTRSEFALVDAEGAPDNAGTRHHAGKDWFAPGGSPVRAPVAGRIVEAKVRPKTSGQIFGGTVKIQASQGSRVWVFRHVNPSVQVGTNVKAGALVAAVTHWQDGPSHAHIELWKSLDGGYDYENMEDPMKYFKAFK